MLSLYATLFKYYGTLPSEIDRQDALEFAEILSLVFQPDSQAQSNPIHQNSFFSDGTLFHKIPKE